MLTVTNDGPLIVETNYWDSARAQKGLVWCSVHDGAIRVLLPPAAYVWLADMSAADYCVLSRGPWPEQQAPEAIEIMWDDGTDFPFALHLKPESFDMLPDEPEPGRGWVCSTWICKQRRPHKALERVCHWRAVSQLPWMKPWPFQKPSP